MNPVLLVHYSEIGTKGKNRGMFERRLREDIFRRLAPLDISEARVEGGRVTADLAPDFSLPRIDHSLSQVFGIAWYATAESCSRELEKIRDACLRLAAQNPAAKTFKIFCVRADKKFPLTSQEICVRLGKIVAEERGLKVDLENHDLPIRVEILDGRVLVYGKKFQGQRGMPGGSAGRVLCLFSGGIDSPVAAWRMMRRGATVHYLHFHPFRRAEEALDSKIFKIFDVLRTYNSHSRLYLLPHYPYQVEAALKVPPEYETVIFRRFMFRAAEALARRKNFKALVTGDSLGQVASQTLENLAAAQSGLALPVFQPLISQDKDDIVDISRKIGTFDLSNLPYKDCCSLMSRRPKTRVSVERALHIEQTLDMPNLVEESFKSLELWDGEKLSPAPLHRSLKI